MSQIRIASALAKLFSGDADGRIVFWNDAEAEFVALLDGLNLSNVTLLRLDHIPALKAKIALERSDNNTHWLVYSPTNTPDPATDWLLDIRLRSHSFHADSASILLEDLGLATQSLRGHLKARSKFLRSKERVDRLKRLVDTSDSAEDLDRKMVAVLVRAEPPEPFVILLRLFSSLAANDEAALDVTPKALQEIAANELDDPLWSIVKREFGYEDERPNLRDLLFRILATDFVRAVAAPIPAQLAHFVLGPGAYSANAAVFAARWRSDMIDFKSYDQLSLLAANELRVADLLATIGAEALADVQTFEEVERRIIRDLKGRVIAGHGANMDSVRALIARRRDGHWANPILAKDGEATQALAACYDALEAAAGFFELQAVHASGFSFVDAGAGFNAYKCDIFRFDQLYRQFMRATEKVEPMGWALLHELRERIEDGYAGWFLPQLSSAWGKVLEGTDGLLVGWRLDGVANQQAFYSQIALPLFEAGAKRLFVVISDAFRFEAAEELSRQLNAKSRVKASLNAMLGVLPSYTALGMASLLPHTSLAYKLNSNLDMTADGMMASTVEQRSAVLALYGGVAVKAEDLLTLGKEKGREFVRPHRLVYVYHDRIDMIGDKQGSETKTFEAVADTLDELAKLTGFIINSLNGSAILITADHGFVYQESAMEEADRSTLDDRPVGVVKAKKRYMLGTALGENAKAWSGNTTRTAGTDPGLGSLDFWVPKGVARFHFAGGARFVHGSAMPQEIVVPVITVRESETDAAKTRKVDISLLGTSQKVVSLKQRFEFIQTEAVSERVLGRTVLVSLRDSDNKPISDEQSLTFDSASQNIDERKRSAILTVTAGPKDPTKEYALVVRDAQTKVEQIRAPYKIDIAFDNDF